MTGVAIFVIVFIIAGLVEAFGSSSSSSDGWDYTNGPRDDYPDYDDYDYTDSDYMD